MAFLLATFVMAWSGDFDGHWSMETQAWDATFGQSVAGSSNKAPIANLQPGLSNVVCMAVGKNAQSCTFLSSVTYFFYWELRADLVTNFS